MVLHFNNQILNLKCQAKPNHGKELGDLASSLVDVDIEVEQDLESLVNGFQFSWARVGLKNRSGLYRLSGL